MKSFKTKKENVEQKGRVTLTSYLLETPRAYEIDNILKTACGMAKEKYDALVAELKSICRTREHSFNNMVVLTGRSIFAARLVGDFTYTGQINYGCLGSATPTIADSDTQLGTEVFRKNVATATRTGSTVNIDFYYSKADTNGTYNEFGMVIDGSAGANTGQLFNHVLTGGWTKSSSESMTVSAQIDNNHA